MVGLPRTAAILGAATHSSCAVSAVNPSRFLARRCCRPPDAHIPPSGFFPVRVITAAHSLVCAPSLRCRRWAMRECSRQMVTMLIVAWLIYQNRRY